MNGGGARDGAALLRGGLRHLEHLSDDVGLLEHADHAQPRTEHGYCVCDNARAVIVVGRELGRWDAADGLYERCLAFVLAAQVHGGRFHNRMGYDRRWSDAPGSGDPWGRAMWALGRAAAHPAQALAGEARNAFLAGARQRSPHPRAMAYAALGAAEVLAGAPSPAETAAARGLLIDAVATIGRPPRAASTWPWPARRLTYANARLPEALIAAGTALRDAAAVRDGLVLLRWLAATETRDDHMSFVPTAGWAAGEPRPAFDQQPIEAWAMADAAARALRATADAGWGDLIERCAVWFTGRNDTGVALCNARTGGGCDGLTATGRNENQGAESTLALIATLQRQPGALRRRPAGAVA